VQKEWIPGDRWVGTKNADYWRSDDEGNKLPYLDSVEFRPIVDPQTRVSALLSGDIDMMQTTALAGDQQAAGRGQRRELPDRRGSR